MNRYLVPMFALVYASNADEATAIVADFSVEGFDRTIYNSLSLRMCEASDNHLIPPTASPHDLTEYLPAGTAGRLDSLERVTTSQANELKELRKLLSIARSALDSLVEECNTNADFATTHDCEVQALSKAEDAQLQLAKIDKNAVALQAAA